MSGSGGEPPHDNAAEQAVLGEMMRSAAAIDTVTGILAAEHYYRPAHQIVHEIIADLHGRGAPAGPIAVLDELRRRRLLTKVGGGPYVHTLLASAAPSPEHYAGIVRTFAGRRRVLEMATTLHARAADPAVSAVDLRELATQISSAIPADNDPGEDSAGLTWLDQVTAERIAWLWPGRLPRGKLVILDGDPGVGKSTLVLDWIARLTTGTPWPDGTECRKGNALIMSAEDGAADTIRPRLDAAGGNAAHVALWTDVPYTDDQGASRTRPPVLPADTDALEAKIRTTQAEMVMIDVLMAYLSAKVDAHKDQDVRGALHRLASVAERTGCCIIILRHLNKGGGSNAIYRGGGSIGIIGQARAAYIAVKDPDDEAGQTRVLACSKMNIAKEPGGITYRLVESELHGCARVQWGEATDRTTTELLGGASEDDAPNALDDAVGWLQRFLMEAGGEADSKDAKDAARKARISDRTLKRALQPASVTVRSEGFPRRTIWSIDPNAAKNTNGAKSPKKGPTGPTGAVVVPFPQAAHSEPSQATLSGAKPLGPTEEWPEGSIGAAENDHRKSPDDKGGQREPVQGGDL